MQKSCSRQRNARVLYRVALSTIYYHHLVVIKGTFIPCRLQLASSIKEKPVSWEQLNFTRTLFYPDRFYLYTNFYFEGSIYLDITSESYIYVFFVIWCILFKSELDKFYNKVCINF